MRVAGGPGRSGRPEAPDERPHRSAAQRLRSAVRDGRLSPVSGCAAAGALAQPDLDACGCGCNLGEPLCGAVLRLLRVNAHLCCARPPSLKCCC